MNEPTASEHRRASGEREERAPASPAVASSVAQPEERSERGGEHVRELSDTIERTDREVSTTEGRHQVVLRRRYRAEIEDVWDAITDAKRISRWFLPVSGDLRLGGRYQFQGNAGGEILQCEPPSVIRATWEYGEGEPSEVQVRLSPGAKGETVLELRHAAVVDPEFWSRFGPGAVGVGWDLGLMGLGLHLQGTDIEESEKEAFSQSPPVRDLMTRSSTAWGAAMLAAGATEEEVATAVRNTTEFYVPSQAE